MPVKREPYCNCGHPISWHEGGKGKCTHDCGCAKVDRKRRGRTPQVPEGAPAAPAKGSDVGALVEVLEQLGAVAIAAARELRKVAGGGITIVTRGDKRSAPTPLIVPMPPQPGVTYAPDPRPAANPIVRINATAEASADLGAGELKVLAAIVQYPEGITREHLTVLTGYKKSTRDLYIQKLARQELIAFNGKRVQATGRGIAARGPFEPLPTGDALREHWFGALPEGEAMVLGAVTRAWPHAVARAALEQATGYKKSTRDLYLQKLIRRELVEDAGPGLVRASDLLFDAARRASA